jgi:ribonuclease D
MTEKGRDQLIDRPERLSRIVREVRRASWVAVDTEADSLYSYPEQLCLIQIGLSGREVLVDPLAGLDLNPLKESLGAHRLILHGADYDLRLLYRALGFVPKGVFDTMLAARLLGCKEFGLERLVARILQVKLEKGPQKANWSQRPLTSRMLEYARNDARYLKPLADYLAGELAASGRTEWHEAMCERLVRDCAREPEVDGDQVWRLSGAQRLSRRGLAVLRELWHWRDREARRLCRPPYFILPHEMLVTMADQAIRGEAWERSLPRRMPESRRVAVGAAVGAALELPESRWPRLRRNVGLRLTAVQRRMQLRLQERRDAAAQRLGIDASLIASRALLIRLAAGQVDRQKELMAWQRELLLANGGEVSSRA